MGFYGDISNSAKTNMTFDIIYPNRASMEANMTKDGVFIGRLVLIEYDDATTIWREAFSREDDPSTLLSQILYSDSTLQVPYKCTYDDVNKTYGIRVGDIVFVKNVNTNHYEYFECVDEDDNGNAIFNFLKSSDNITHDNGYIINYNIDRKKYPNNIGRGWDSTVWQKVYDNGVEKYVMIAELNSVTPTFSLEADPPTSTPIVPHFDSNSTNLYYTLHWQPNWGLRIKSSKKFQIPTIDAYGNELKTTTDSTHDVASTAFQNLGIIPSDMTVKWSKTVLNGDNQLVNSWFKLNEENNTIGQWTENISEAAAIPAAIYFNKAGFDPNKVQYSPGFDPDRFIYSADAGGTNTNNIITDMITLEPTGRSGMVYQNHQNTEFEAAEDIQELSIMLPTIGNIVAKMWDMIYCDKRNAERRLDPDDGSFYYFRRTNYHWQDGTTPYKGDGVRLFNIGSSGIPVYTPTGANSIAGCINSVHDLLGMIIVNSGAALPRIEDIDENKIYFTRENPLAGYGAGYYRKKLSYEWDTEDLNSFKEIVLTPFDSNATYYHKEGVNYIVDSTATDSRTYYYFKDPKNDLLEVTFDGSFEPDLYYYQDWSTGVLRYMLFSEPEPAPGVQYYQVERSDPQSILFYAANRYYYQKETLEFASDYSSKPTAGRVYFTRTFIYDEDTNTYKHTYKPVTEELVVFDPENDPLFTFDNKNYTQITEPPEEKITCYRLTTTTQGTNFYSKNTYYFRTESGDLMFTGDADFVKNGLYVQMVKPPIAVEHPFYQPNKYFYQNIADDYVIDTEEQMTEDRVYFEEGYLYVKEDALGILPVGSIWRGDRENVPETITLAVKRDKYTMALMPDFATTLNTLNGLILKMNTLLEFGDEEIRDTATAQGCINTMNDIIDKFAALQAGNMLMVDNYGRIHGTPLDGDTWIDPEINDSTISPSITLKHKNSGVIAGTYGETSDKTLDFGNSLKTVNYTVDTAGHITSATEVTVTLPSAGDLELTNYTALDGTLERIETISDADTVNSAFAKMQATIEFLNARIEELEKKLQS